MLTLTNLHSLPPALSPHTLTLTNLHSLPPALSRHSLRSPNLTHSLHPLLTHSLLHTHIHTPAAARPHASLEEGGQDGPQGQNRRDDS